MSKIEFHEITLDDKTWMDARFQEDDRNACGNGTVQSSASK